MMMFKIKESNGWASKMKNGRVEKEKIVDEESESTRRATEEKTDLTSK